MKKTIISLLLIALSFTSFSQVTASNRCGTDQKMEELRALDPAAYDANLAEQKEMLQNWIKDHYAQFAAQRSVITIPVVVHIWENSSSVPNDRVYEQIVSLNEDFRNVNADTTNIPAIFDSVRADIEIEFCLASTDPNGNPTTGIVRETAGGQPNGNNEMWDNTSYLNIYVYGISGGTLGFTQVPSSNPNYAVHIGTGYFGNSSDFTYNLGRTATHEIGHWLNLEHIWGGGCGSDDGYSDTPNQSSPNYGCPSHPSTSCSNDGDMTMNYMDYTDDACMNMLTKDQKIEMIAAINTYRPGLLSSSGCSGSRVDAAFSPSSAYILAGTSIDFTDETTGIGANWNYNWVFNGAATSSSTDQNPAGIAYNSPGSYTVVLYIDSAEVQDIEVQVHTIVVHDGTSGVENNEVFNKIDMFPNPTSGEFTLSTDQTIIEILVTDITGKTVLHKENINQNNTDLDLRNAPNGSYLVKIKTEKITSIKKIQIIK